MGKQIPMGSVKESSRLSPGNYRMVIDDLMEDVHPDSGKYLLALALRVVEPEEAAGSMHTERFYIGTDEDLEADDAETWINSYAAGRLKRVLRVSGVESANDETVDIDALVSEAPDHEFDAQVEERTYTSATGEEKTAVNLSRVYAAGTLDYGLAAATDEAQAAPKRPPRRTAKAATTTGNGQAPDDDETEVETEVEAAAPARPSKPAPARSAKGSFGRRPARR